MSDGIIFLYGAPGSGKSTIGQVLAHSLDRSFFDLDLEIEQASGKAVWQIFADEGEAEFRRRETDILKNLIGQKPGVIALGGGSLLASENRKAVENAGKVIVLDAPLPIMHARLKADTNQRPLLAGELEMKLGNLLETRSEHYRSFKCHVDNGELDPAQAAWQIQTQTGLFHVKGMGKRAAGSNGAYDVSTQTGELRNIGHALASRELKGPLVLVTDDNIGPLYAAIVLDSLRQNGYAAEIIQIPAGEDFKNIQTVNLLWEFFLASQLDRSSTVIALGGGVVSDLTGFAAATYLRGIKWVCLPTTLLCMVDASIGGKTGADLPSGKNLIGAFHAPALVLADPHVLESLPEREIHSGLAEIIKHGVISDPLLFETCKRLVGLSVEEILRKPLAEIISRAMAVKIGVIEQDPYEQNIRATLNAGHTIGHAIELVSNYTLSHGEAVSIGLVVEARMAEELGIARAGLADEISAVLAGVGLPVKVPDGMNPEAVETAIFRDKKRAGSGVKFALPVEIGQAKYGVSLTLDELRRNHAFNTCFTRS
jgi:shikimate kinase/3-dehydroquinate synthase